MSSTNTVMRVFAVLLIVFLAIFNYVDRAILVPNQEFILMDLFAITRAEAAGRTAAIGLLHTVFKWSAASLTILYGYLNDKFPRKYILVGGSIGYGVCTLLTFNVTSYDQLVIVQILTAVSIGASLPTSYSILSDLYPQKSRGRIFGLFGISTILGDILGNMMVTLIFPVDEMTLINWRLPFMVVGIVNLVLAGVIFLVVKEPKRGAKEKHLDSVLAQEGIEYSYRIRKKDLADLWKVKSNRWLIFNFVDNMTGGYMLATAIPWLGEHGAVPEVAGILILLPALGILGGNLFFGWLGDKIFLKDSRGRVLTCLICVFVSFALLPVAASLPFDLTGKDIGSAFSSGPFIGVFSVWIVYFFFNNGIGPHWHATIIDVNRIETRGSMLSVATFFEEFGEGLGILIGAFIHDIVLASGNVMPYSFTWGFLTVFLAGGAIFWIGLYKNVAKDIASVNAIHEERARMIQAKSN